MSVATSHLASTNASTSATGSRVRPAAALATCFVLVWLFSLSRSLFDPLGVDQGLYQYMTDRVIAGQRLYLDVWDQNLPGIIAIHWISTRLFGPSAIAFRLFDACWQALTLLALATLVYRDGRRWTAGLLAALLYALVYYGYGYMQTGQREGFAVVFLLLAAHAMAREPRIRRRLTGGLHFFAGAMCFAAFVIKPTLGLCYGVLWCWSLGETWRERRRASASWAGLAGLTLGFLACLAGTIVLLGHFGILRECWLVLTRADMQDYVVGPGLIRSVVPEIVTGTVLIVAAGLIRSPWPIRGRRSSAGNTGLAPEMYWIAVCAVTYALLISIYRWEYWRSYIVAPSLGILLPATGAVLSRAWTGRSRVWRLLLLLGLACLVSLVMQGRFSPYQALPFLACAASLAAIELVDKWKQPHMPSRAAGLWLAICLAAVAQTTVGLWWREMTSFSTEPYVLVGKTLDQHYDRVTRHKLKYPRHATTIQVARRVQELTAEDEPVASLCGDPRVFYYCQRPPVCRLFLVVPLYEHFWPASLQAIRDRRPRVVLACTPPKFKQSRDLAAIEAGLFDEIESVFGPDGRFIRKDYRLTDKIDELCVLQPIQVR